MKKYISIGLCLIMTVILAGCGSSGHTEQNTEKTLPASVAETEAVKTDAPSPSDTVWLSMATSGNWEDIARGEIWNDYCEKLSDWSGGKLQIRSYFNGSLGNDLELIEGAKEGTLSIINSVPSYQISVVPEAALLDVPGLFDSTAEYNYFVQNYYMPTLVDFYLAHGLRLLSSSAFDFRVLTANTPVRSVNDLKGLKLRTMENPYHMAFWQALGASAISMNFNQVRLSIQQGILQAQENPLGYMVSSDLLAVQDQVVLTNHVPMINNFLMNETQYQALSEENRELLARFFKEMNEELVNRQPDENEKLVKDLSGKGINIYDASDDIKAAIKNTAQQVVIDMLRKDLGDDIVDDYLEKVAQAKAEFAGTQP